MSFQKNIFIAIAAFGLGFYASEYRHAQQPQSIAYLPAPENTISSAQTSVQSPAIETSTAIQNTSPALAAPAQELSALEQAQQLIANNAFPAAVQALNEILKKNPNDTEALLLLARVLEKQGKHEDAVTTWFRYLNIEVDAKKFQEATAYVSRYLIRLVNNPGIFGSSREWLMAQLNDLIKLTPDNGELHLQLADMHAKADDQEQAQYHALMAANQDETRTRAEEFLAKLTDNTIAEQTDDQESKVQLIRFGKQFLVPVVVEGKTVKLLLDTGASISGLTSSFINRNYSFVKSPKPIQLNTASGTVDSFLFVVDSLQFAGVTFNKHMLARLPMDNYDNFDGLLGVDILGRFEFIIDQEKAELRLRTRK
ncbi:MAG: hypothetical protein B0W54_06260 [Cellvibrio sp. 79]|nr:MAG: hypothetical protein B0W54_06260 [Cellvibrio sp. 79]